MTDDKSRRVKRVLEGLGFKVEEIPTDPKVKRADLRARKDAAATCIEVKSREEDPELRRRMEAVRPGQTESILVPLEKHNSLSSIVKSANEQLAATAIAGEFRVLWFLAEQSLFVHDAGIQMASTLLGVRIVAAVRGGRGGFWPCYFAAPSDFYRYREIDGAVLQIDDTLQLIPNPFSPRASGFLQSPVYRTLAQSVHDVPAEEARGDGYIVYGDVDRKSDMAVLEALRKRYPSDTFQAFALYNAGTDMTTIDARAEL